MAKYRVMRAFSPKVEYAYVEADSEEEAKEKAIENDCWEKNPNDIFLYCEYIVEKEE